MKKFITGFFIFLFLACGGVYISAKIYQKSQERTLKTGTKAAEITLTVVEGWTADDIAQYLEKQGITGKQEFLETEKNFDVSNYQLLASKPKLQGLEGFLFPDTYRLFKPGSINYSVKNLSPSTQLIEKMLDNFSLKFTAEMQKQAGGLNMSVYQILTLASIIEKETGRNVVTAEQKSRLDDERKIIAGIFYNRLKVGMPLQSDATINYITKKNSPAADTADTQIDSPYNTYKYKGLPPGPICNPSLSSILAALNPTKTDYFYFLHKQPSGEPVYSKTLEEHNLNKAKYLKQ